jgi:hypothetical protein
MVNVITHSHSRNHRILTPARYYNFNPITSQAVIGYILSYPGFVLVFVCELVVDRLTRQE